MNKDEWRCIVLHRLFSRTVRHDTAVYPMDSSVALAVDTAEKISFVPSNKGQKLLVLNSHIYRCNKKTARKKYWKCAVKKCSMLVHTDENDVYIGGGKEDHNHEPNGDLIGKRNIRQGMKQRVMNEATPISLIYEEELTKAALSPSSTATFPTHQEICKWSLK